MDRDNSENSLTHKDRMKSKDNTKVYRAILPTVGVDFNDEPKGTSFNNNEFLKVNIWLF